MNLRPWIAKHFGPELAYEHFAAAAVAAVLEQENAARATCDGRAADREEAPSEYGR